MTTIPHDEPHSTSARRYRHIETRIWGDEKFRRLSTQKPSGQALWLYLLTGPHTSNLPGLWLAGKRQLAEALGWSDEDFDRCWAELEREGMAQADWGARVIWLPKSIKYNPPDNPNVVKKWAVSLADLPECNLKRQAMALWREHLAGRGEAFAQVNADVLGAESNRSRDSSRNRSSKGSANRRANQEQEQELEQELFPSDKPAEKGKASSREKKPRRPNDLFDAVAEVTVSDPKASGKHIGKVCRELQETDPPYTPAEVRMLPAILQARGFSLPLTLGTVTKYIGWTRNPPSSSPSQGNVDEALARQAAKRKDLEREREAVLRNGSSAPGGQHP
jgi:hypothetical protein